MRTYVLNSENDKSFLSFEEFVGGWIGGIGGLAASHPVDTIKVRLQFGKGTFPQAIASTYKKEGILGFYKGIGFPITMAGIQNAIFFGVYANVYRALENKFPDSDLTTILIGGWSAGFVQVLATTPVEIIKVRLQTQDISKKHGILGNMKHLYSLNGISGFYHGFIPTACRDVPSGGFYIGIYLYLDSYLQHYINSYWSHLLSGGIAGMLSFAPFTPFDVVKTRMQADNPRNPKYKNVRDCFMKSYAAEGPACFWRGFVPFCMRSFVNNAAVFCIYEICISILS